MLPLKRSMTHPPHFLFVMDLGFIGIILLLIMFGTVGYCGFGEAVNPNGITMNLPPSSPWTILTQVFLVIGIFATYPIVITPVVEILDGLLWDQFKLAPEITSWKRYWSSNLMRLCLVGVTTVIAISIPHFSLFVSLVGALGSSFIAFIVPCLLHMKLFGKRCHRLQFILNGCLVVFGVFASIVASTITILQLIEEIFGFHFSLEL